MRRNASNITMHLADRCAYYLVLDDFAGLESFLIHSAELTDILRLQVVEPNGFVVGDIERGSGRKVLRLQRVERIPPPTDFSTTTSVKDDHLVVWQPIAAGTPLGWLKASYDLSPIHAAKAETWRATIMLSLFWVACSTGLLLLVFRPLVRSIHTLTDFAQRLNEQKGDQVTVGHSTDEIVNLAASLNDASQRLRTSQQQMQHDQELLRKSEQKFRVVFDQAFQFIGVLSTDGMVLQVNQTALQFAGVSEDAVLGKPFWETPWWAHSTELQQRLRAAVQQAAEGELVRFEATHTKADGAVHCIDFSLKPVTDTEGRVFQLITEGRDITERKQAEEELLRYKEHLEETVQQRTDELRLARDAADLANTAKSVFLANMSHELRTPLNAILGFSQLMHKDRSLSASQRENLEIINNSGDHLLRLINDVLEIAKIEAGKLQLEIATFDLQELVREVSDMMRLLAQQKGLQLDLDQSSEIPRFIKGDEARLRQILINLVSNAVKFTEQGGVTIRLRSRQNAHHHLLIEVEDSGSGISKKDQQLLFHPFEQLSTGASKEGTGLGLTIVQRIVQLMGGKVSIESELGKGSLFRVELPLEEVDKAETPQLNERRYREISGLAPGQPHYRILIAEDQRENQLLLSKLMTDLGLETKVVENGEECVQLFKKWKPDLIWMDRRMPVMDGVEATRRIRELPSGDKVKIVAVTASALKDNEIELRAMGMDDYISKPYHLDEIYDCLESQLGLNTLYSNESPKRESPPSTLTSEMLGELDDELCVTLHEALDTLNSELIAEVIRRIAEKDRTLARLLENLADNYDYPTILNALDNLMPRTERDR